MLSYLTSLNNEHIALRKTSDPDSLNAFKKFSAFMFGRLSYLLCSLRGSKHRCWFQRERYICIKNVPLHFGEMSLLSRLECVFVDVKITVGIR